MNGPSHAEDKLVQFLLDLQKVGYTDRLNFFSDVFTKSDELSQLHLPNEDPEIVAASLRRIGAEITGCVSYSNHASLFEWNLRLLVEICGPEPDRDRLSQFISDFIIGNAGTLVYETFLDTGDAEQDTKIFLHSILSTSHTDLEPIVSAYYVRVRQAFRESRTEELDGIEEAVRHMVLDKLRLRTESELEELANLYIAEAKRLLFTIVETYLREFFIWRAREYRPLG